MEFNLYPWQETAVRKLKPGSILYGKVGSGKTLTALVYYLEQFSNRKLYVITTAKKRDTGDWEDDASKVGIKDILVDSWNNIKNYRNVKDAFFIFDEQRVVGYGSWSKTFIALAKKNKWILLSGTPGDVWMDYMPVFVANGFYRNKTDFENQHIEYDRFVKFPKIKKYHNTSKLMKLRSEVLVPMNVKRDTIRHLNKIKVNYDNEEYKEIDRMHWNPYKEQPMQNPSEYVQVLRRLVSSSDDRVNQAYRLMLDTDKIIIFYNYDYERKILLDLCEKSRKPYSEWSGHRHEEIPIADDWVYIVQYTAGAEGWNCTETDTMLFYSLNYSYKMMEQAQGRIDRINTKYKDLNYYYFVSNSPIDKGVLGAIDRKKRFNASAWVRSRFEHA